MISLTDLSLTQRRALLSSVGAPTARTWSALRERGLIVSRDHPEATEFCLGGGHLSKTGLSLVRGRMREIDAIFERACPEVPFISDPQELRDILLEPNMEAVLHDGKDIVIRENGAGNGPIAVLSAFLCWKIDVARSEGNFPAPVRSLLLKRSRV